MQFKPIFLICFSIIVISYNNVAYSTENKPYEETNTGRTYFDEKACNNITSKSWSGAELFLWKKLCLTDYIDFKFRTLRRKYIDPNTSTWPETRKISGQFLEEILSKKKYRQFIENRSLQISNIWLHGDIYLKHVNVPISIEFIESKILSTIDISHSAILGLAFNSSTLKNRLEISNSSLEGGLQIYNSIFNEGLEVFGSSLGKLSITESTLYNEPKEIVLRTTSKGRVIRRRVSENESLSIILSKIGDLSIVNAALQDAFLLRTQFDEIYINKVSKVDKPEEELEKRTISFSSLEVNGSVNLYSLDAFSNLLASGFIINDGFIIHSSTFNEVRIHNTKSYSLNISKNEIESFSLFNSNIKGDSIFELDPYDIVNHYIGDDDMKKLFNRKKGSDIEQRLSIHDSNFGSMSITDSRIRDLYLSGVDISKEILFYSATPKYKSLLLRSVNFGSLYTSSPNSLKSDLQFLELANFTKSIYIQFSNAYRLGGLHKEADKIMIAAYNRKRQNLGTIEKVTYYLWEYLTGYGYKLEYVLGWLILWVAIGSAIAYMFTRNKLKQHRLAFWFSLDLFLPIVRLNDSHYSVKFNNIFVRHYFLFHQLFGFLLVSYLIAGLIDLRS